MEVTKGKFEDVDIQDVVKKVHDADIEIIANYLFGLTGDTFESMQKTLDLSLELCTIAWNTYAVMDLPGSGLYKKAIEKGLPRGLTQSEISWVLGNNTEMIRLAERIGGSLDKTYRMYKKEL